MPPLTGAARLLRHVRRLAAPPEPDSDADLLSRFLADKDEAAFAAIVARHGPMVLRLCRRVVADSHAAEDCFQATFLVLARRAASVRRRESLAAWLYGVALRVARKAHRARFRLPREALREDDGPADPHPEPLDQLSARELLAAVDDEVRRLPAAYRLPVILCCLEGRTREEAAQQLGWTEGAVKGRLERGRKRLHARLTRRGLTLTAAFAVLEISRAAVTATPFGSLAAATARAASLFAAGKAAVPAVVSVEVIALAKGVVNTMLRTRFLIVTTVFLALAAMVGVAGVLAQAGARNPDVRDPSVAAAPVPEPDVSALLLIGGPEQAVPGGAAAEPARVGDEVYRQTQLVLLKSRLVLGGAVQSVASLKILKDKADPAGWLEKHLHAAFVDDSAVLRVTVLEGDPVERAALANAVADAYVNHVSDEYYKQTHDRLKALHSVRDELTITLSEKRNRLLQVGADHSLQQKFASEDLAQLRQERLRVHLERVAAQAQLNYRKTVAAARDDDKAALAKWEEQVSVLTEQERLLKDEIDPLVVNEQKREQVAAVGGAEASSLREDIDAAEQAARRTAAAVEALQEEQRAAAPRVRILQRAQAPGAKN